MVKVKVCGLTNLHDALAAAAAGADLLGFIFFPDSPRYVTPEQVRTILTAVREQKPQTCGVGVFVNVLVYVSVGVFVGVHVGRAVPV